MNGCGQLHQVHGVRILVCSGGADQLDTTRPAVTLHQLHYNHMITRSNQMSKNQIQSHDHNYICTNSIQQGLILYSDSAYWQTHKSIIKMCFVIYVLRNGRNNDRPNQDSNSAPLNHYSLLVSCDFLNKYTWYIESDILCDKQFKSM